MKKICSIENTGSKIAFLIGAGRSGTTLLYKLLCLHPKVGFISNYDNRLKWLPPGLVTGLISGCSNTKLKAWFNTGGNAYFTKRPLVKKLFPTPVEGESIYQACGVPLYPDIDYSPDADTCVCLCDRFEKIRRAASADIVVSKRTANNRRLRLLDDIFPGARYVHLIRDGRDVANSLSKVEWWDNHVVWWDGRTARQMEAGGNDRLKICAKNWVHEIRELHAALASMDAGSVIEVRYEQLLTNPLVQLERVMKFLGLEMSRDYRHAVDSLKLVHRPSDWNTTWSSDQLSMVLHEQRSDLEKLGYLKA